MIIQDLQDDKNFRDPRLIKTFKNFNFLITLELDPINREACPYFSTCYPDFQMLDSRIKI